MPIDRSGARGDGELVDLWCRSKKSDHTRRAYGADAHSFLSYYDGELRAATVRDLLDWIETLKGKPASRARRISSVRSLLTFGHRTGYLAFNVGAVIERPTVPNEIAKRILTEAEVHRMLDVGTGRAGLLVCVLYASGARVSEACALLWEHVRDGVLTLHGKGGKTRHVRIAPSVVERLETLRGKDSVPVFATKTGKCLHPSSAARAVRSVARKAKIMKLVTPHWLRHAHASHAITRGASAVLVRDGLGHSSLSSTSIYSHARPNDGSGLYLGLE